MPPSFMNDIESAETLDSVEVRFDRAEDKFFQSQKPLFRQALELAVPAPAAGQAALDIGYSDAMMYMLRKKLGYASVAGAVFVEEATSRSFYTQFPEDEDGFWYGIYETDPERSRIQSPDGTFSFISCLNVIGRLGEDPMFLIEEINRVLQPGGYLLLSTPNAASALNLSRLLAGFRPHYYLKFNKNKFVYRQRFEYDIHSLTAVAKAGGFTVVNTTSANIREDVGEDAATLLVENNYPSDFRGEMLFMLLQKQSPVLNRYPAELYD